VTDTSAPLGTRAACREGRHWPPIRKFSATICGTCRETWPTKSVLRQIPHHTADGPCRRAVSACHTYAHIKH